MRAVESDTLALNIPVEYLSAIAGSQYHHGDVTRNPNIGPIESHPVRAIRSGEGAQYSTVASAKFCHRVASFVRDPHVSTIEGDAQRIIAYRKCAQHLPVGRAHLGHSIR